MIRTGNIVARFLCVLVIGTMLLSACEPGAKLIVENRFSTEVTIMYEGTFKTRPPERANWGIVPAGEVRPLAKGFWLNPHAVGYTIWLQALDQSGNVLWQKTWTFEEFVKLEDVGWKIVVGPETSS